MKGKNYKDFSPLANGVAIYPGQTRGQTILFDKELVEKINSSNGYAIVAGCLVYDTLHKRHFSRFCGIISRPSPGSTEWTTPACFVFNDAN